MQQTLLQQWTDYAYYAKQVVEKLEGQLANPDCSPWLVAAINYHHGEQHSPEQAVSEILEALEDERRS